MRTLMVACLIGLLCAGSASATPLEKALLENGVKTSRAGFRSRVSHSALQSRFAKIPLAGIQTGYGLLTHEAIRAEALGTEWVVVRANTGLWLHEAKTFKRRARLSKVPVRAIAASPDGRFFAYATDRGSRSRLTVLDAPSLQERFSTSIDQPHRMRFSNDGRAIAIASRDEDSVTLLEVETGRMRRLEAKDDVNDAIAIDGHPSWVGFADDGDDVEIYDFDMDRKVCSTRGMAPGGTRGTPFFRRDQDAIAYDPLAKMLYGGGDDNRVWRFSLAKPQPKFKSAQEFKGNVQEIVVFDKDLIAVALDSLTVQMVYKRRFKSRIGPLTGRSLIGRPIRIAKDRRGQILAVMGGYLIAWRPGETKALVAPDYQPRGHQQFNQGEKDTAIIRCSNLSQRKCQLYLMTSGKPAYVEAKPLGPLKLRNPRFLKRHPGERLIAGFDRTLKLVKMTGDKVSRPVDTRLAANGLFGSKPGGVAYLVAGKLYELDSQKLKFRAIAKVEGIVTELRWEGEEWQAYTRKNKLELVPLR